MNAKCFGCWIITSIIFTKNGIFTERLTNIEINMENWYTVLWIHFFCMYFQTQVGLDRQYFSFDAIYDYFCDIFEEVDSDEE